jgi:hypothetical protein
MTEEEAENKWCPHVRRYHSEGSYNRTDNPWSLPDSTFCVGSRCMAWRWVKDPLVDFVATDKTIVHKTSNHGYCGLAGPL